MVEYGSFMKIAIIGTGFVADYYMTTLANHPQLVLAGAYDCDAMRLRQFAAYYKVATYPDFGAILADREVGIVVNLTTPESHYSLSKQALEAGKHVYCEKPLAMRYEEAAELVAIAERLGLTLASAPANALSAAHDLVSKSMTSIGKPRLVYAQMGRRTGVSRRLAELALGFRCPLAGAARVRSRLHAGTRRLRPVMACLAVWSCDKPERIFSTDFSR